MQCGSAGALPSRRARGGLTDRASIDGGWHRSAIVTVATCSLVSGALEGAAFRILAPLVGVSMFLSAGVVGAVLAGMSIGNFLGGRLASRSGSFESLRSSLIGCAIATLFVAPLWKVLLSTGVISQAPLLPQIVAWSFLLFFPPALALGLITPQVIRLTMTDPEQAGRVSGRLYAWSTLGCIAGILLSAWLLIERFGAVRTTVLCGAGLVPLIVLVERRIPAMPATSGVVRTSRRMIRGGLLAAAAVLLLVCKSPYDRETRYFSLSVSDDKFGSRAVKLLTLDRLVHSAIDPTDPTFLHYPHEHIQGHFTRAAALTARTAGHQPRVLVIGGGGYSFPRWVESQPDLADVRIDVVEIDPGVTEIAHDLLGLSRSTRIHSIHMDGRQFVKSLPPQSYDLIIQDAVNDFSVPYHLMTRDYNALIRQALRPDAAYLLTVIDSLQSGRFLASAVNTMQSAFPDTRLMAPMETIRITGRSVFIIGGRVPQHDVRSPERIAAVPHWWSARTTAHVFPSPEVRTLIDRHGDASPVLTDDYAPVDTLMAGHFMDMPID